MARATTSRGASSSQKRRPVSSMSTAPSPRSASVSSGTWSADAPGPVGDPVGEGGRMELHELEVGQRGPGPGRHRHTVADRLGRGRRDRPQVGVAPGGEHHDRRQPGDRPLPGGAAGEHTDHVGAGPEQVHGHLPALDAHPRRTADGVVQRPHQLGAGGVAGVHDALDAVGRLAAEGERAVGGMVEAGAQALQPRDHVGSGLGHGTGHGDIDEAGAGGDRVGRVVGGAVAAAHGRGHPALRPGRGAALTRRPVGQHHDRIPPAAVRATRAVGQRQRRGQPGHTGPDDDGGCPADLDATPAPGPIRGPIRGPSRGPRPKSSGTAHRAAPAGVTPPPVMANIRSTLRRARAATSGSRRTSVVIVSSEWRILASVIRFMWGQRLQGRTNSVPGDSSATLSAIEHSVTITTRSGRLFATKPIIPAVEPT